MTEHGGPPPGPADVLWPLANFLPFVAVLVYYLRGPVREFFRERAVRLREALEAGTRARREAETLRAELERDVRNLPALRERMRADLRASAERERDVLLASGREAAQRIREDARLLAEQEIAAARQALRDEVTDEVVRQATAALRQAIQPGDQERFVREFVADAGATR